MQECVSAGVGVGRRRGAEGQVAVGVGACVFGLHLPQSKNVAYNYLRGVCSILECIHPHHAALVLTSDFNHLITELHFLHLH